MRVLILARDPSALCTYFAEAGEEAITWQSNDMLTIAIDRYVPDAVVYCEDAEEIIEHTDAVREAARAVRVVLVAARKSPLVPYAAALGVKDFVFTPAEPAAVLERVRNPASYDDAAAAVIGMTLSEPETAAQEEKKRPRWTIRLPEIRVEKKQTEQQLEQPTEETETEENEGLSKKYPDFYTPRKRISDFAASASRFMRELARGSYYAFTFLCWAAAWLAGIFIGLGIFAYGLEGVLKVLEVEPSYDCKMFIETLKVGFDFIMSFAGMIIKRLMGG